MLLPLGASELSDVEMYLEMLIDAWDAQRLVAEADGSQDRFGTGEPADCPKAMPACAKASFRF